MFNKIRTTRQLINLAKDFQFVEHDYALNKYELYDKDYNIIYRAWVCGDHVSIYDNNLHVIILSKRGMKRFIKNLPDAYVINPNYFKGLHVFS
jgi:hypothetical protein